MSGAKGYKSDKEDVWTFDKILGVLISKVETDKGGQKAWYESREPGNLVLRGEGKSLKPSRNKSGDCSTRPIVLSPEPFINKKKQRDLFKGNREILLQGDALLTTPEMSEKRKCSNKRRSKRTNLPIPFEELHDLEKSVASHGSNTKREFTRSIGLMAVKKVHYNNSDKYESHTTRSSSNLPIKKSPVKQGKEEPDRVQSSVRSPSIPVIANISLNCSKSSQILSSVEGCHISKEDSCNLQRSAEYPKAVKRRKLDKDKKSPIIQASEQSSEIFSPTTRVSRTLFSIKNLNDNAQKSASVDKFSHKSRTDPHSIKISKSPPSVFGPQNPAKVVPNWHNFAYGKDVDRFDFWQEIIESSDTENEDLNEKNSESSLNFRSVYGNFNFSKKMTLLPIVYKWIIENYGDVVIPPLNVEYLRHCSLNMKDFSLIIKKFPNFRQGRLGIEEITIIRRNLRKLLRGLNLSRDGARTVIKEIVLFRRTIGGCINLFGCFAGMGLLHQRLSRNILRCIVSYTIRTSEEVSEAGWEDVLIYLKQSKVRFCYFDAIAQFDLADRVKGYEISKKKKLKEENKVNKRKPRLVWTQEDWKLLLENVFRISGAKKISDINKNSLNFQLLSINTGLPIPTLRVNVKTLLDELTNYENGWGWSANDKIRVIDFILSKPKMYSCIGNIKWARIRQQHFPNIPLIELRNILKITNPTDSLRKRCEEARDHFKRVPKIDIRRINFIELCSLYDSIKSEKSKK